MSAGKPDRIVCEACGRSGPFRPELVGKRIKCKCGHITRVIGPSIAPESAPAAPDPLVTPAEERGLYGLDSLKEPASPENGPVRMGREHEVVKIAGLGLYPELSKKPVRRQMMEEKGGVSRLWVILVALAVVIGLTIVGVRMFGSPAPAKILPGEDADIQRKIDSEYNKEIHAWFLEDPMRLMGPWTRAQALNQADLWQKDGAKRVLAFGTQMSVVAVIELPDDPAQRKRLFDWQATWHKAHFEKVWTDVGQKYLMIRLGI